jgi:hypothetical protein
VLLDLKGTTKILTATKRTLDLILVKELNFNFIFQIVRNFTVEYNYEMKFGNKMLHIPVTPLKFKIVDRE